MSYSNSAAAGVSDGGKFCYEVQICIWAWIVTQVVPAEMHHGYTMACLGFDLPTKHHHLVELWGDFSLVVSSLKN